MKLAYKLPKSPFTHKNIDDALKELLAITKLLVEAQILVMSLATNISELCRRQECQAKHSPGLRPVGGA